LIPTSINSHQIRTILSSKCEDAYETLHSHRYARCLPLGHDAPLPIRFASPRLHRKTKQDYASQIISQITCSLLVPHPKDDSLIETGFFVFTAWNLLHVGCDSECTSLVYIHALECRPEVSGGACCMTTCSMQREMMMYSIILASICESSRCDFVGCEGPDSFDSKPNSTSSCSK
jgi:hypothetical protein